MKAYRVFGIALVTGTDAEMDKLEQVAAGTHHVHRNQKGGPRKRKEIAPLPPELVKRDTLIREGWEKPVCEHGQGMTDYCYPCGRVNGQEAPHVSD